MNKDYVKMYADFEDMEQGQQLIVGNEVWMKIVQSIPHHLDTMMVNIHTGDIAHFSVVMDSLY